MSNAKPLGSAPDFEVNGQWDVARLCAVSRIRSEKNRPELDLLSVFLGRGVIPYVDGGGQVHKPGQDLSVYQAVYQGDLVLNNQQAWRGSVGVSRHFGIISPAYLVLKLSNVINPTYANYLFQSRVMVSQFLTSSKGVGDIQRDIHTPWLKNVRVPVPPSPEQAAIVRFLNYEDARIRRYIRAKQKMIELLEEQKQVITHRAVTRGLDPSVRLKPSGLEWLEEVPEDWEVRPAKWFFREVDERSVAGTEELLSVSHLTGVTPRSQKSITMFMAESYVGHKLCRPGDLVINTMWAWMAALGVSRYSGIVSPAYGVYRAHPGSPLLGDYADLLLRTRPYVSEYLCRSTGIQASRLRLYPEQFLRIAVMCPKPEEQRAILEHVRRETAEAARTISLALHEIDLLREYRTRLIADVVTGKVDVRDVAARLPDETEEAEPLDAGVLVDAIAETGDELDATLEETEA